MTTDLTQYIGRKAVYLESGSVCVVSIERIALSADFWQVCWLFGAGGIRVFFQPEFITRSLHEDVNWLEEFFDGCEDGEDSDEPCG